MTRLTMRDYYEDRPTFINGVWWGCKSVGRGYAEIVHVTPTNDVIQSKGNISVGYTEKFANGLVIKVTNVLLSGTASYADVIVTGIVTPPAPEVPEIPGIPEPPAPGEICTEAYNTDLVIKIPNKDGGFKSYTYNVYVPPVCTPAPGPICTEGEVSGEVTCWDGSKIHTLTCKDGVWMPLPNICPPYEIIPPPVQAKTVKILTTTGYNLPNAYVGKTIEIIAAVMCGLDKSDGEYALLTLDGTPIAEGRTGSSTLGPGFVSFKWTVTGESGPRKLCVRVPKSDVCPNYSEAVDCKIMMVSSVPPSIAEQLELERGELRERLELIRLQREFQETLQKGDVDFPSFATLPTITIPETDVDIEKVIEEWEEHVGDIGTIRIPSIPIPEQLNLLPTVSIDNNIIGYPPINVNVVPGKHTIKVELKGLAPIYKTVTVEPDQVLTITDLSFI